MVFKSVAIGVGLRLRMKYSTKNGGVHQVLRKTKKKREEIMGPRKSFFRQNWTPVMKQFVHGQ